MKCKKVVYNGAYFPVIYENNERVLLFTKDPKLLFENNPIFSFNYSTETGYTKVVYRNEIQETNEIIDVDYLSVEILTSNLPLFYSNSSGYSSIPLIANIEGNYYGIILISESTMKAKILYIAKTSAYVMFDLKTGEVIKHGSYNRKILKALRKYCRIKNIEDMYTRGSRINSLWDDELLEKFENIRNNYKESGNIDMNNYNEYINLFYSYYPKASKYTRDPLIL